MIKVGQRLQEERLRQGLSIAEVSKATKIRPQFLMAIEKGDYRNLPSSAYIQGFIRNYTEFLNLPVKNMLALFKREFDEREYIRVLPESFTRKTLPGFRLGWAAIFFTIVILFVVGYITFQYRSAFLDPQLTISSPKENATVVAQIITIVGKTEENATVTMNDEPVYVQKDGSFTKDVTVFIGQNSITIKATNNFGRKTVVVRHITAKGS